MTTFDAKNKQSDENGDETTPSERSNQPEYVLIEVIDRGSGILENVRSDLNLSSFEECNYTIIEIIDLNKIPEIIKNSPQGLAIISLEQFHDVKNTHVLIKEKDQIVPNIDNTTENTTSKSADYSHATHNIVISQEVVPEAITIEHIPLTETTLPLTRGSENSFVEIKMPATFEIANNRSTGYDLEINLLLLPELKTNVDNIDTSELDIVVDFTNDKTYVEIEEEEEDDEEEEEEEEVKEEEEEDDDDYDEEEEEEEDENMAAFFIAFLAAQIKKKWNGKSGLKPKLGPRFPMKRRHTRKINKIKTKRNYYKGARKLVKGKVNKYKKLVNIAKKILKIITYNYNGLI